MSERQRLDVALVARGLVPTRARARDLVARGLVMVAGVAAAKAGQLVAADAVLGVAADEAARVSRGGVKLEAALAAFAVPVAGRLALDLGASTGGFVEVLLAAGARHVTAVDVGHGQLHPRLTGDARVTSLEGRDARSLTAADLWRPEVSTSAILAAQYIPHPNPSPEGEGLGEAPSKPLPFRGGVGVGDVRPDHDVSLSALPGIITADLSFIALEKALPAALALSAPDAWLVVLVKPQFELGRDALGKGGIVRADVRAEDAVDQVAAWLGARPEQWLVEGSISSPLTGGDGNREFLLAARRVERA